MILGIDVSENNGEVDWDAVAEAGVKFAIVRCSYGKNSKDEMFQHNVQEATARGIKCGAYHYGYGLSVDDAILEAENCRNAINEAGVLLELPVFYDFEDADGYKDRHGFAFDREENTAMCKAFIDNLQLDCGIYASCSWLETYIDWRSLGCAVWNAQWGDNDDIQGFMWQFSENYEIDGKAFDADYMYE